MQLSMRPVCARTLSCGASGVAALRAPPQTLLHFNQQCRRPSSSRSSSTTTTLVCRARAFSQKGSHASSPTTVAMAAFAAAALITISSLEPGAALAAGEPTTDTQTPAGVAPQQQPSSRDPGWGKPSPMPHPPASPPQTPPPSPSPGTPPALPRGPPDLLPRKPPPPQAPVPPGGGGTTPQLPDVPPQLLPPCAPNPSPPQLLPPCPPTPPPIKQLTQSVGFKGGDGASSSSSSSSAKPGVDWGVRPMQLSDTADAAAASAAAIDAAFDAVLLQTPPADAGVGAPAAAPSSTVTPSSEVDSSSMSINLDGNISPPGRPTAKQAATAATSPTSKKRSSSTSPSAFSAGGSGLDSSSAGGVALAEEAGSITLGQVLTTGGQLALQLLEVLVRVSVVVIKYSLKAFIWLVQALAKWVNSSSSG